MTALAITVRAQRETFGELGRTRTVQVYAERGGVWVRLFARGARYLLTSQPDGSWTFRTARSKRGWGCAYRLTGAAAARVHEAFEAEIDVGPRLA